jgi:hypothetical protein
VRLALLVALLASIAPVTARAQENPYADPPVEEEVPDELEAEPDAEFVEPATEAERAVEAELAEPAAEPVAVEPEPVTTPVLAERDVLTSSPRSMLGPSGALFLETGLTRGRWPAARVWGWSTELGVRYRVAEEVIAEVSWGLTFGHALVIGETMIDTELMRYNEHVERVEAGNPTIAGYFVHRAPTLLLEVGLAFSVPTAARDDIGATVDSVAVYEASSVINRSAMAMRGYRGAYRWAPERFSLAVPFRVAFPIAPLVLEIDGALAVMIPVIGDRGVDVDVLLELGATAGVQVYGPLHVGVRLGVVGSALGVTAPDFTLSAEPYARLRFDPVQLTLRGVMNLAGDDGIGGDRGPSFGLFLGAGVEI